MRNPAELANQIGEAAKTQFGRRSTVRRFLSAAGADVHGVLLVEQDGGAWLVADWRVKHDEEIGFADEAVGLSKPEADQEYQRRIESGEWSASGGGGVPWPPGDDDPPLQLDVESALSDLVDIAGERWRVVVRDAGGCEIAAVAGQMVPPEAFEQEGVRLARFGVSREGMEASVRFPMHPSRLLIRGWSHANLTTTSERYSQYRQLGDAPQRAAASFQRRSPDELVAAVAA